MNEDVVRFLLMISDLQTLTEILSTLKFGQKGDKFKINLSNRHRMRRFEFLRQILKRPKP